MSRYLIEVYAPAGDARGVEGEVARAKSAAAQLADAGSGIRYLRSILVPADETCFHLLDADDAETLARALGRAGIEPQRLSEAIELA